MAKKDTRREENEELLSEIFNVLLKKMLSDVKSGDSLDARQVSNMIKLFKDNGINIDIKSGQPIELPDLPEFNTDYACTN
jgi:hypothetical protein